jgi:hypothetical protein
MLTNTRKYKAHSYEGFVFKNTCLLKSLKIKKSRELRSITIRVNGVDLSPSSESGTHYTFDFAAIRNTCRNAFGFTKEENDLICIEETFAHNAFLAMQYYKAVPVTEFKNTVFTSALQLAFIPKQYTKEIKDIEVEEEYYLSDVNREAQSAKSS